MIIKSGVAKITKKEFEAIKTVLIHSKIDIKYGWGGSFGGYDEDSKTETKEAEKEVKKAELGIELINHIINSLVVVK